jgi:hypothetical protein
MLLQAVAMKFPISSFSNVIYKVKGPLSGRRPSLGGHANCQVTLYSRAIVYSLSCDSGSGYERVPTVSQIFERA